MIEEEGKCRAEAEARGLPAEKSERETGQGKERRKRNMRSRRETKSRKIQ